MRGQVDELLHRLAGAAGVLIRVDEVRGSGPRAPGAWMAAFADATVGTIGGGHLEFEAIAHARALLGGAALERRRRFALGPALGQCCGGVVWLAFEPVAAADRERLRAEWSAVLARQMPVALFGGGHVGRAIVELLGTLPVRTQWIDSRDQIFPAALPANAHAEHSEPVHGAVAALEPGSHVLIMSFSHAEDLDIVAACLKRCRERADLPFIGLIGSKSKWAAFRHRLEARGFAPQELAAVTCPIGVAGVVGKEPEVIAVAVAAQLMQQRAAPAVSG
ncbi:MAG TPA: xanthine dehydrogenase accessory protein XdhC [Rubrivivax sp.]|nr:xanthine dehydrogenase accessory protein XdhC [Rubrivivax sp.]